MKSITKTVESFFRREGIKFKQAGHTGVLKVGFAGEHGCFLGYSDTDEEKRTVHIQTILPVKAPRDKRLRVAELIARINQYLLIGNFELNMDSGLIGYKTSIMLGNGELLDDTIEHLLFGNWSATDRYFPACNLVIFGDVQLKKAVEMIRKSRGSVSDNDDDNRTPKIPSQWLRDILGGSMN